MKSILKCDCEEHYFMLDNETYDLWLFDNQLSKKILKYSDKELKILTDKINDQNNKNNEKKLFNAKINFCNRLIINLTSNCNLACKYCYADGGAYNHYEKRNLSIEDAKKGVDLAYSLYDEVKYVQFFGGEPFLNFDIMIKCIDYINVKCKKNNLMSPKYTIVTNGTLVNLKNIKLLKENFESITVSLDGSKNINDYNRLFLKNNSGTFDIIQKNIELIKEFDIPICIESTITKLHIDDYIKSGDVELYHFCKNLNVDMVALSPLIDAKNIDVSLNNCNKQDVLSFFDKWAQINIQDQLYKNKTLSKSSILKKFINKSNDLFGCGVINSDLCIDVTGDLYPCFMFCGYDEYKINNNKAKENLKYLRELLKKPFLSEPCDKCFLKNFGCVHSHCIGSRFLTNKTIDKPIKLGCEISETMTKRILFEVAKFSKEKKLTEV